MLNKIIAHGFEVVDCEEVDEEEESTGDQVDMPCYHLNRRPILFHIIVPPNKVEYFDWDGHDYAKENEGSLQSDQPRESFENLQYAHMLIWYLVLNPFEQEHNLVEKDHKERAINLLIYLRLVQIIIPGIMAAKYIGLKHHYQMKYALGKHED